MDALFRLLDAAETCNGAAQKILSRYCRQPVFRGTSTSPRERRVQERAMALKHLRYGRGAVTSIWKAMEAFDAAFQDDCTGYLVQEAVALNLKTAPVFVGKLSYPTAHDAARALGETVLGAWQDANCDLAIEHGPDRMGRAIAGLDDNPDVASEACAALRQRLRKLRKRLPADLFGRLQLEYHVARQKLDTEQLGSGETVESKSPRHRARPAVANPLIAAHLTRRPHDSAEEVRVAVGCSKPTVISSPGWRGNQQRLKEAKRSGVDPVAIPLAKYLTTAGDSAAAQIGKAKQAVVELDEAIDSKEAALFARIAQYVGKHPEATNEEIIQQIGCTVGDVCRWEASPVGRLAAEQRDEQRYETRPPHQQRAVRRP